jgi:hypothetical protein
LFRKSLIAAFIVFFGTAFVAMPVASANPIADLWEALTGGNNGDMEEEPVPGEEPGDETGEDETGEDSGDQNSPEPQPEDSTDDEEPVKEPELPESPSQEGSQSKSGKSSTQPQSASGNTSGNAASGNGGQLPKTATPYPTMLLIGGLVLAAGLALLRVRPSRG